MNQRVDKRTLASEATKEKLLDASERLFAVDGLEGVPMRQIAAKAGVDLAMINYHFDTKEGLYQAVFRRRAEQLNAQRLEVLERMLAASHDTPDLEAVVVALVEPYLRLRNKPELGGLSFARLLVREVIDSKERERGIIKDNFDDLAKRIISEMSRALPGAAHRDLVWAYYFALGTLLLTMASTGRLEELSEGDCQTTDIDDVLQHIVPFIVCGIRGSISDTRTEGAGTSLPEKAPAE